MRMHNPPTVSEFITETMIKPGYVQECDLRRDPIVAAVLDGGAIGEKEAAALSRCLGKSEGFWINLHGLNDRTA